MSNRQNCKRFARVLFVDQEGRLLVIRQRNGAKEMYCYPGGKVEDWERPQKAASREIFEELGIRKRPKSLRPILRKKFWFGGVSWIGSYYLAVTSGITPTLLERPKVFDVRFVSLQELEELTGDYESLVDVALSHSSNIDLLTQKIKTGISDGTIL